MIRLYSRMLFAVLAAILFSGAVMWAVDATLVAQFYTGKLRDRLHPIFNLTERALDGTPESEWVAKLAELEPMITHPVQEKYTLSLSTLSQTAGRWNLSEPEQNLLDAGGILYFETQERQAVAVRRLGRSDHALELWLPGMSPAKYAGKLAYFSAQTLTFALLLLLWVRPFWRDLRESDSAAARLGSGHFRTRLELPRSSPLFPLAAAFNSMAARIEELLASHRELTTAVSHELRNPLMRLRFRLSLARDEAQSPDQRRQLDEMETALDELDHLVDEILTYARMKSPDAAAQLEAFDASAWLQPCLTAARGLADAEGRGVRLGARFNQATLVAEPHYMARAVSNLLSNAVRFAKSRVEIEVSHVEGEYLLAVDDDGPGVPEAEREFVFEPFWRGDQSRTRQTGGFGIGLALVRRIARWHGGDASVENSPLGGARFVVRWPEKERGNE